MKVGLVAAALLAVARFYPFDRWPLLACPWRTLTGLPCPGCGGTRAFVRFVHGDVAGAFTVNPLATLLAFASVLAVVHALFRFAPMRGEVRAQRSRRWLWSALGVAVVANWIWLLFSASTA